MQAYIDVFGAAAVLQKLLLAALLLAAVITVAVTIRRLASPASAAPSFIVPLQIAAPALGLATAGLEAEHMMGTVLRLPGEVSLQALAPGFLEMSTLAQAGAAVGLLAVAAKFILDVRQRRAVQA